MTPADMAATYAAAFPDQRAWTQDEFAALRAQTGCLIAGTPDSFAIGRAVIDEAELLTIATHPAKQRQGLGSATLSAFEDAACARGVTTIHLEVATDNAAALRLYANAGYVQTGRRKSYYPRANRPAVDALVLSKMILPHF